MNLFKHWSWATMLRATYAICCSTYGARFQTFCKRHLDLVPGQVQIVPPAGSLGASGRVIDQATLDRILKDADAQGTLNFWEIKLIRERTGTFDEIHLLRLNVEDPSQAGTTALQFTFGFALTQNDEFVYFRVQDHLRRMGLARDALVLLCQMGCTRVSPATRSEEEKDPEAWRRFRMLLSSAREEARQTRRASRR
jgi:hypothetical protein